MKKVFREPQCILNELYYFYLDDINLENFVQELVDALWKIHADVKANSNDDINAQGIALEVILNLIFMAAVCVSLPSNIMLIHE